MTSGTVIMVAVMLHLFMAYAYGAQRPHNDAAHERRNYAPRRPSKYSASGDQGSQQGNRRSMHPSAQGGGAAQRPVESYPEYRGPQGQEGEDPRLSREAVRGRTPAGPGPGQSLGSRDGPGPVPGSGSGSCAGQKRPELVDTYAQNPFARLAVALAAGSSSLVLTYVVVGMLLSSVPKAVPVASAAAFFVGTFLKRDSDFGELSRALGVLSLVILRRAKLISYVGALAGQTQAACGLAKRRAYPPGPNPWKYAPVERTDPDFNMYTSLFTLILLGALLGKMIAKPIPLFPAWMGSLGVAAVLGYATTFRDERGDLLRFVSGSLTSSAGSVQSVAEEVHLLDKAATVGGRSFAFLTRLDQRWHVREKLTAAAQSASGTLTGVVGRIQSDIAEPELPARGASASDRDRYRYRDRDSGR